MAVLWRGDGPSMKYSGDTECRVSAHCRSFPAPEYLSRFRGAGPGRAALPRARYAEPGPNLFKFRARAPGNGTPESPRGPGGNSSGSMTSSFFPADRPAPVRSARDRGRVLLNSGIESLVNKVSVNRFLRPRPIPRPYRGGGPGSVGAFSRPLSVAACDM